MGQGLSIKNVSSDENGDSKYDGHYTKEYIDLEGFVDGIILPAIMCSD